MKTKRDLLDYYRLNNSPDINREEAMRSLESKFLRKDDSLFDTVEKVMREDTGDDIYRVHKRRPDEEVRFSTDNFNDRVPEVLVLDAYIKRLIFESKMNPIVALRYEVEDKIDYMSKNIDWKDFVCYNNDVENFLGISYVQAVSAVNKNKYQTAKDVLGSNPHELLVANFLSRIAPVVNLKPQTKIVLKPSQRTSAKTLRDRFFDKNWELNPDKQRVRQILGENNAWLKQEAIEQRYAHLNNQ